MNTKLTILAFVLTSIPLPEALAVCEVNQLEIKIDNKLTNGLIQIQLQGTIETPSPNYDYLFHISETESVPNASLALFEKDASLVSIDLISPLEINEVFWVQEYVTKVKVDVSKPFNWGPEYFPIEINNIGTNCLMGSFYK